MNAGKFLAIFAILIACISIVSAIGTNDVVLNGPANKTFTKQHLNFTAGFNFSWHDHDTSPAINKAICTLYIQAYNATGINATKNKFRERVVKNYTDTIFHMNHSLPVNNTIYFWTIGCYNSSASPTRWMPTPRAVYQDNVKPAATLVSISITNKTWTSNNTLRIEARPTDNKHAYVLTCYAKNLSSNKYLGIKNTTNNTAINFSATLGEGNTTIRIGCKDQANNEGNASDYRVPVDSIAPVVTIRGPADGFIVQKTALYFNISIIEKNLQKLNFSYNGTWRQVALTNCTHGGSLHNCTWNNPGMKASPGIKWNWSVYDTARTRTKTVSRTLKIDPGGIQITNKFNWTLLNSIATFQITLADYTPTKCVAMIINSAKVNIANITGRIGTVATGGTSTCGGNITSSDVALEGEFTVKYRVFDGSAAVNNSNMSGIKTNIYAGWNVIGWPKSNTSTVRDRLSEICGSIQNCTQASYYNNSKRAFVTYTKSTPGTNNKFRVPVSDAVLVYSTIPSYLISNDYMPGSLNVARNTKLEVGAWNTLALIRDSNMSAVLNVPRNSTAEKNITYATYINASSKKYYTCRRSIGLCAGTSKVPTNIKLYKGYGLFVLVDRNSTINRSAIFGG